MCMSNGFGIDIGEWSICGGDRFREVLLYIIYMHLLVFLSYRHKVFYVEDLVGEIRLSSCK